MNFTNKILLVTTLCLLSNCAMLNSIHTAKPLDPGVASLSLSIDGAASKYSYIPDNSVYVNGEYVAPAETTLTIPMGTLLPNVQFQMGVTDNIEVGAFIVPMLLGFEANVKYRFYHDGPNHLAIIPYGAYFLLYNYAGGAHLVYTRDITETFSISFGSFCNTTYFDKYSLAGSSEADLTLQKNYMNFGGYIAPTIAGESVYFTPSFEYNSFVPLKEGNFKNWQTFRFRMTLGFYIGKAKKQLNRIETKIDKIEQKIDNLQK